MESVLAGRRTPGGRRHTAEGAARAQAQQENGASSARHRAVASPPLSCSTQEAPSPRTKEGAAPPQSLSYPGNAELKKAIWGGMWGRGGGGGASLGEHTDAQYLHALSSCGEGRRALSLSPLGP